MARLPVDPAALEIPQVPGKATDPGKGLKRRAALGVATAQRLKQIGEGAGHELVVPVSASEAIAELVPLLDRLMAVGYAAHEENTTEGWQRAHRLTLDANVMIRVSELRHAASATMDYEPSASDTQLAVVDWLVALRNLKAQVCPHTSKDDDPADASYLESLIDGTGDLLSSDTHRRIELMFIKYPQDSQMHDLLETACEMYGDAVLALATTVLAMPNPKLTDVIVSAILEAQGAAREAAAEAIESLQGRFDLCGWAQLRLTVQRDSALWAGFFEASALPAALGVFKVMPSGENEIELTVMGLNHPSQGFSVHTSALSAALEVLKEQLEVKGWVHSIID